MPNNALVIHGGGPTAVLNASLSGVVAECNIQPAVGTVYGALKGAAGFLADTFVDLSGQSAGVWPAIEASPGTVLGTSRQHLSDDDFDQMLAILRRHQVRYVFPTGGNGTMEMALRLSEVCRLAGYDACVIGVPKTIDNDLFSTDHTPGYASAARFFIHALQYIGADNAALPGVTVVEILGRDAGWLSAATLLARERDGDAPHLVYLPERPLPFAQLAADVDAVYRKRGRAVIAVCEGQLDETGQPFGADVRRTSRTPLALNLAHVLSQRLAKELGISARSEKPGLLGRSFAALASPVDLGESKECGRVAVRFALAGETGLMVTIGRGSPYRAVYGKVPIKDVSGKTRLVPAEWMPSDASQPSREFEKWLEPLVGKIERLGRLSY
jgi:6-phosphofructokinase